MVRKIICALKTSNILYCAAASKKYYQLITLDRDNIIENNNSTILNLMLKSNKSVILSVEKLSSWTNKMPITLNLCT